jgi:hypothetical protein
MIMRFIIIKWEDKPGTHSGEFPNYKSAVIGAIKLSRETKGSVSIREIGTGQYWGRFVNGKQTL